MCELRGRLLWGSGKAAKVLHTRGRRPRGMRGKWLGDEQIPVGLTGILRLKDGSNSFPLGLVSLRMSFSLFQRCVSVSPGQNSLFGEGWGP